MNKFLYMSHNNIDILTNNFDTRFITDHQQSKKAHLFPDNEKQITIRPEFDVSNTLTVNYIIILGYKI